MEQKVQHGISSSILQSSCIGMLHLAQYLPLTNNQRVQTGSHQEKMLNTLLPPKLIGILLTELPIHRNIYQLLPQSHHRSNIVLQLHHGIYLAAVAGRQHHCFLKASNLICIGQYHLQFVFVYTKFFANLHRSCPMIQPQHNQSFF